MRAMAIGLVLLLAGCSAPRPTVDCALGADCTAVVDAAESLLPSAPQHLVVGWSRGLAFHAEVHACYADGRYLLVDVLRSGASGQFKTSLRADLPANPPCR